MAIAVIDTDPRFATFPREPGTNQLCWLIDRLADGTLGVDEFVPAFRRTHEALERAGRPRYHSKEEARLLWDMLWALEFYSPEPALEARPADWNDAAVILAEARRISARLRECNR